MTTAKLRTRRNVRRSVTVLSIVTTLAFLAGCTSTNNSASASTGSGTPSGTLQFIAGSATGLNTGFRKVNAAFEKKYPKVKIVYDPIPDTNYPAAESSRLTAGNVDIVAIANPMIAPSYAKGSESNDTRLAESGGFVNLTKEPFMKRFIPSLVKSVALNGKNYSMPTGLDYVTGVYYNKSIFKKYGLSVPTTWSQFLKVSATLKSHGVTPLGIGDKDSWPAGLAMLAAVQGEYPTTADKTQLAEDLWKQKVKLTDPKPLAILQKTETMFSLAEPDFAGVPYANMPAEFAGGQFAMTIDGTWDETTIASAVGSKFDFGYFPMPTSDNPADNKYFDGKVEIQLAIPSSSKNKTAALAYLNFFSQEKNYKEFLRYSGFVPGEAAAADSPFYRSIKQYTTQYMPVWEDLWTPNSKAGAEAQWPFNYTSLVPVGTDTVKQAAEAAQQAWAAGF